MKTSNFNTIAPIYDLLVRLFFGSVLWKAQKSHLYRIRPDDAVLILGGGTGRILGWLPASCSVTYLELSSAMMRRVRKRGSADFVQADFLTQALDQKFDWIVCPFFLDCFDEESLKVILKKIRVLLNDNGNLIVADFNVSNTRQRGLANLMIWFFRLTVNLSASGLLPIQEIVSQTGFIRKDSHFFRGVFIFSDIYSKSESVS